MNLRGEQLEERPTGRTQRPNNPALVYNTIQTYLRRSLVEISKKYDEQNVRTVLTGGLITFTGAILTYILDVNLLASLVGITTSVASVILTPLFVWEKNGKKQYEINQLLIEAENQALLNSTSSTDLEVYAPFPKV